MVERWFICKMRAFIAASILVLVQLSSGAFFMDDSLEGRLFCDFKRQQCKWSGWDRNWEWLVPEKAIQFDGPPLLGSNYDHALFANFTHGRVNKIWDQTGPRVLSSPLITPKSAHSCFRFSYSMRVPSGPSNGLTLTVIHDATKKAEVAFSRGGEGEDRWFEEEIDIIEDKYFRLHFEAYSELGYIAIQSVQLDDRPCYNPKRVCDFEESNTCGWQSESQNRQFVRMQSMKTSQKVKRDVSTDSIFGNVIAVEDLVSNQVVKLLGPNLVKDIVKENMCFSFWSQRTHGAYVHLNLLRRRPNGEEIALWKSNPDFLPPNEWKRTQVNLNFSENISLGDRLVFEVESEVDRAALALDDIQFQFVCESSIACRFSEGLCGWIQDETVSDASWSRGEQNRVVNASRLDKSTIENMKLYDKAPSVGPIYTDFTNAPEGVRQRMELHSNFVDGRKGCAGLLFTVDNIGEDLSNSFRMDQLLLDGRRKTVWAFNTKEYSLRSTWRPTQINIPAANQPYRLVLHASSTDPSTRIGMEDISFTQVEHACQPIVLPTEPAPQSQIDKTIRRLLVDLLRGLRSDTNRIGAISRVFANDPINPAINDIVKSIEKAIKIAQ